MFIDRRMFNHFNYHLLTVTLLILCAGLMVLYSAGYNPDSVGVPLGPFSITVKSVAFARQFAFMGMGLVALVIGMSLSSQNLYRVAYPLYVLTLGLLIAVLLFGTVSNGSRRWFSILGFRFQPSEFVKVAVILVMARYLSKVKLPNGGFRLKNLILPALIVLVPMGLIIKQPDLGTGLVIGAIGAGMLLFVGINTKTLAVLVISGVIAIIPVWHSLHDYQKGES